MRTATLSRRLARAGGAVAAAGLALGAMVVAATPASAAACSGTSGVTVVVDTGSSTSTRCASGDPSSAMRALTGAGFSVTTPQMYPGTVVCRINGFPESDPCVRMPPADAYWAFFHAERGGSWHYSSTGVTSYDPAQGTVVGFRFGSGQQPRVAPPAPSATSEPEPTKATTTVPKTTTSGQKSTAPAATTGSAASAPTSGTGGSGTASGRPTATTSPTSPSASASTTSSAPPSASTGGPSATTVAAAPTSQTDDPGGPATLLAGAALVALVAAATGWAAWKRRA